MAPGGRPPNCALPQVPGVFPQTAAVHLVAAGNSHHQDCVLLHCHGLRQRGMKGCSTNRLTYDLNQYPQREDVMSV